MSKEVYFATLWDNSENDPASCASWPLRVFCFACLPPLWLNMWAYVELFLYAVLISSQPATTISLFYSSLAHYTHWFWVTVILLEVRNDTDVSRPPTRVILDSGSIKCLLSLIIINFLGLGAQESDRSTLFVMTSGRMDIDFCTRFMSTTTQWS